MYKRNMGCTLMKNDKFNKIISQPHFPFSPALCNFFFAMSFSSSCRESIENSTFFPPQSLFSKINCLER